MEEINEFKEYQEILVDDDFDLFSQETESSLSRACVREELNV